MFTEPIIYASRLSKIRQALRRNRVDGFLVTDMNNIRYLTGFSGTAGFILITETKNIFVTDFRYKEQSEKEVNGWDIVIERGNRLRIIKDLSKKNGVANLGFESSVSYDFFRRLSGIHINLSDCKGLVEKLRETKDDGEINCIKEAVGRAEAAFLDVKPFIRRGVTEISIARRLESQLRQRGCCRIPFNIIVASGPHSAMPHAGPTERKIDGGDLVIIDWGGEANGYYSDMTRTIMIGGSGNAGKKKKIYQTVLEANKRAISCISPKVRSKEIDEAGRSLIQKAGYGDFFGHGTGHGVGIQIHEAPRISWNDSERIKENMVFTIEPGVYVPGVGGVRIEDMVLVQKDGAHVLTSLDKRMEIV